MRHTPLATKPLATKPGTPGSHPLPHHPKPPSPIPYPPPPTPYIAPQNQTARGPDYCGLWRFTPKKQSLEIRGYRKNLPLTVILITHKS